MKKEFLPVFLLLFFFSSCSKEDNEDHLNGIFVETSPVEGRTTVEFRDNTITILKQGGSKDRFEYEISEDRIKLIPSWDKTQSTEHRFEKISNNVIKIGNLYPSFPEFPDTLITFERR